MVQFYLLAVILNILGGLILAAPLLQEKIPMLEKLHEGLRINIASRMVFILLSLVVGIFKILSVTKGDVAVVGDLLPALSLLLMAGVFFLDYYKEQSEIGSSFIDKLQRIFVDNKSAIGITLVVIGLLHFLFPRVLFL
ncbi:MAG: hypothetical protein K9L66_00535 [Spirochaetaceae bacterium]|nr:hypothetical protein [Spirochaetaceae bacterium]MCF7947098.1 hypothetical protein [Spirochaetia bacterium]MCF7950099.1 hypothetical protein [Spirochaetaceae bacterium]